MIDIIQAGVLTSVQDLGRHGHRRLGIHPGGVLNTLALSAANLLAGNPADAAGIEITLGMCEMRFRSGTRIALGGDDAGATLNGKPVPAYWSIPVPAGSVFRLNPASSGSTTQAGHSMRTYLAVAGGIDVPLVLGSRSTDLKAGFGGYQGRALRNGDRLQTGDASHALHLAYGPAFGVRSPQWHDIARDMQSGLMNSLAQRGYEDKQHVRLRVLPGPEFDQFDNPSKEALWTQAWRITPNSNRMGCRLEGMELRRKHQHDMLSHGVVPGVIQVPPSGQPIILMGDAQTTGGYPKIGVVISADMWKLAQAPLNSTLHLVPCNRQEALMVAREQQHYLDSIRDTVAALVWSRTLHYYP